jgi:DNA-binding IclR family transcriptional regulator
MFSIVPRSRWTRSHRMSSRRTLSSVRNAARLLKVFSALEPELGVTELSERLEIGKSTVHRLLATLCSEGLIEQNTTTGRYRLGVAVHDLGGAVSTGSTLHSAVLLPMSDLRNRTGETVQLGVLDGREVVYIERLESPNAARAYVDDGRRRDAHSTGSGKCLLAFLTPHQLDRLLDGWDMPQYTPHTVTNHTTLRRELLKTRRRGYAINLQESEVGVLSVAAPIRDTAGRVVAAISVAGLAHRLEPSLGETVRVVIEAAATASRRLGWRSRSGSDRR